MIRTLSQQSDSWRARVEDSDQARLALELAGVRRQQEMERQMEQVTDPDLDLDP